jgi:hypothetical protein
MKVSMAERAISRFRPNLKDFNSPVATRFQMVFGEQFRTKADCGTVSASRPGSGPSATAELR